MIEIRELVIRATVDDRSSQTGDEQNDSSSRNRNRNNCCQENVDNILKMLKEKRER